MLRDKTYEINYNDKINVETSLYIYIKQQETEIEKFKKGILSCENTIKSLQNTKLKIAGVYYGEKPDIYDENLKGVWEGAK
jgi:hypothetical protein